MIQYRVMVPICPKMVQPLRYIRDWGSMHHILAVQTCYFVSVR